MTPPSSTRRCGGRASSRAKGSSPPTSGTPSVNAACASAGLCPSMRTTPTRSGRTAATRAGSASSRAFVEATMRPLGCSMIEDTAGSRGAEAVAALRSSAGVGWMVGAAASAGEDAAETGRPGVPVAVGAGVVASRTLTPAAARSAARKADTGPSPSAVISNGASTRVAGSGEPATASSVESERAPASSAA